MRYKLFGRSGLRVSELCLGAMTFGTEVEWGAPKEESRKVFDAFVEAGGNFVDTANRYTDGTSEKWVGEFVGSEREHFVIATKYTLYQRRDDPNAAGNQRKNMMESLHASLKRLGTDYVDVFWVHAWDPLTPIEEVLRGLDDLVRSGKVLYVGISDTPAWVVSRANAIADLRGWTAFAGLQIEYSLVQRAPERDLLPMARALDLAVTPWGVLGSGVLSGKYLREGTPDGTRARQFGNLTERNLAIAATVEQIAKTYNHPPSQVAINWVRQQPGVIIPLMGARTAEQLNANLGALEWTLMPEHLKQLDEVSKIELGFPHDFLTREAIRSLVYGGTFERIDNHREF
jgi:aryl-alcohol dehydrogenase-like predicted oxidoreductase